MFLLVHQLGGVGGISRGARHRADEPFCAILSNTPQVTTGTIDDTTNRRSVEQASLVNAHAQLADGRCLVKRDDLAMLDLCQRKSAGDSPYVYAGDAGHGYLETNSGAS